MILYISDAGEIRTEQHWMEWALEFYDYHTDVVPIPLDWWERTKKVLGLVSL